MWDYFLSYIFLYSFPIHYIMSFIYMYINILKQYHRKEPFGI